MYLTPIFLLVSNLAPLHLSSDIPLPSCDLRPVASHDPDDNPDITDQSHLPTANRVESGESVTCVVDDEWLSGSSGQR